MKSEGRNGFLGNFLDLLISGFEFLCSSVAPSKIIGKLPASVLRVWNQSLIAAVHYPVKVFQRDLANDVRQRVGDLHDVEPSSAALDVSMTAARGCARVGLVVAHIPSWLYQFLRARPVLKPGKIRFFHSPTGHGARTRKRPTDNL